MTLVFAGKLGALVQQQLGINEIASCVAVGKAIGSVLTRKTDGAIFKPFSANFGITLNPLPQWLKTVELGRSGTIRASNMRPIAATNTLEGLGLDTLEGVTAFCILVTRFVETRESITTLLLDQIFRGLMGTVINGGTANSGVDLPYALRSIVRNYVGSVLDADADSPQASIVRQGMADLAMAIGKLDLPKATRYAHHDHSCMLGALLGDELYLQDDGDIKIFNTLFAGSASIALAAFATGADIVVECVTTDGTKTIPTSIAVTDHPALRVRLWLCQPPENVTRGLQLRSRGHGTDEDDDLSGMDGVIFGGADEISRIIARELSLEVSEGQVLAMWNAGVKKGESANWTSSVDSHTSTSQHLKFFLKKSILERNIPDHVASIADCYFKAAHGDVRHDLARTVAGVVHDVLNCSSYSNSHGFQVAMQFVLVSMAVGTLCSLLSNKPPDSASYAWAMQCVQHNGCIKDFCERAISVGIFHTDLLWAASSIWGGSTLLAHGNYAMHDRVLGIVAPHRTVLLDIVRDPLGLAEFGLSEGIIALYRGSLPMLPHEQASGYVVAARSLTLERSPMQCDDTEPNLRNPSFELILRIEVDYRRAEHFRICGWVFADVAFELDPLTVMMNLLGTRHFDNSQAALQGAISVPSQKMPMFHSLDWNDDLVVEREYDVIGGILVGETNSNPSWLVAVAGCAPIGKMIIATEEEFDNAILQARSGDSVIRFSQVEY